MKLIAITRVKNEIDIIEPFVRHHARYFDRIIVLDDGSSDGTYEMLRSLQGTGLPIVLMRESSIGYNQQKFMTRLMYIAADQFGADWIVPLDADEFIEPPHERELKDVLLECEPEVLSVCWSNFLWRSVYASSEETNPVVHLNYRMPPRLDQEKVLIPASLLAGQNAILWQGNHGISVENEVVPARPLHQVSLCHFPIRSVSQFAAKIAIGYLQYAAYPDRQERHGFHYEEPFQLLKTDLENFSNAMEEFSRSYGADAKLADSPTLAPLRYVGGPLSFTPKQTNHLSNILMFAEYLAGGFTDEVRRGRRVPTC